MVPGTTTITASSSNINLDNTSNNFTGAVSVTGKNVTLVDAGAIELGTSVVSGFYKVTATAGGGITDSGVFCISTDKKCFLEDNFLMIHLTDQQNHKVID